MKIKPINTFLIFLGILAIVCFGLSVKADIATKKALREGIYARYKEKTPEKPLRRWVCGNTHIQNYLNELTDRGAKVVEIKALTEPHGIYGFYDILVIYEDVEN